MNDKVKSSNVWSKARSGILIYCGLLMAAATLGGQMNGVGVSFENFFGQAFVLWLVYLLARLIIKRFFIRTGETVKYPLILGFAFAFGSSAFILGTILLIALV